uniref:Immunoglobulin V-set domain-containing protein n=1 Tax=Piliocolobus tephrosceles TaxID=591936 RepID=A0A8C9HIP8_9PRIM
MERRLGALLGLLWVQVFCEVRGVKVEQSPSVPSLQERTSSTMRCSFSTSVNNVQWFQQNRGLVGLINLFFMASWMKHNGKFWSKGNSKELCGTLHITAAQLKDSGTYFRAVEAQFSQEICSLDLNCSWACTTHCRRFFRITKYQLFQLINLYNVLTYITGKYICLDNFFFFFF